MISSLTSLSQALSIIHSTSTVVDINTLPSYIEAYAHARDALHEAEQAFFDPSMVSLLYFPPEHQYAVYMPLFTPIAVPLVAALIKEVKAWRALRKSKSMDGFKVKVE